jgi:hypothetical protein
VGSGRTKQNRRKVKNGKHIYVSVNGPIIPNLVNKKGNSRRIC